jgi:hypothetical protein
MKSPASRLVAIPTISALLAALLLAGCAADPSAADPTADGDVGETADSADALTSSCKLSRDTIIGSVAGERATAIERGFAWFDAHVPYSQSRQHEGYRTDCSGFVSMCWELGTSLTTASFSAGTDVSHLGSYNDLEPADALVRRVGGTGHVVLFLGWNDAAHTAACVLEEASTASDMQFRTRTVSSLKASSFKPIRADKF